MYLGAGKILRCGAKDQTPGQRILGVRAPEGVCVEWD